MGVWGWWYPLNRALFIYNYWCETCFCSGGVGQFTLSVDNMGPLYLVRLGNRGGQKLTTPSEISFISFSFVTQMSPLINFFSVRDNWEYETWIPLCVPDFGACFVFRVVFILSHLLSSPYLQCSPVDCVLLCPDATACNSQMYVRLIDCFFGMGVNVLSRLH